MSHYPISASPSLQTNQTWRAWGDHPPYILFGIIVSVIGAVAGIIAIISFLAGTSSLSGLLASPTILSERDTTILVPEPTNTMQLVSTDRPPPTSNSLPEPTNTLQPVTDPALSAVPYIVPPNTPLDSAGWSYKFPQPNYSTSIIGALNNIQPQGQFVVVMVLVINDTSKDQVIPTNFLSLKMRRVGYITHSLRSLLLMLYLE